MVFPLGLGMGIAKKLYRDISGYGTSVSRRDTYLDLYHKILLKCENGSSVFSTKILAQIYCE